MVSSHSSQHRTTRMRLKTLHPPSQASPPRSLKTCCNETHCFLVGMEQRLPFLEILDERLFCLFILIEE